MNKAIWNKCVEFHGHECPGLTIGYRASLYAIELLELKMEDKEIPIYLSDDEQLVCISENDACGIDAIQVIMGCSVGKGNMLFHMRGKSAYSFYDRNTGRSIRLVLKPAENLSRDESFDYYQTCPFEDMFEVKETTLKLPEETRIFRSIKCSSCGEKTSENFIRLQGDERLCLDCYTKYDRFSI